jgi:RNA polymerase sigma-70 factor (ECF subfamily)
MALDRPGWRFSVTEWRARGDVHGKPMLEAKREPVPLAMNERDARLTALFQQEASFVWRVVRRLGVPDADAEDAVQEVFMVVARRLPEYEERGSVRAWLVAIARQVALHAQRARFRRERKAQAARLVETPVDPQAALEQSEAAQFIQSFLNELDRDQALVFYLVELEGLTAPEIAASLQVKLNTVYGRLRLARQRFEARVAQRQRVEGA